MRPTPIPPGPGQESVWDYPRPPALEPTDRHLVVVFAGQTIAETRRGLRVLETSQPPAYYFPSDDIAPSVLQRAYQQSRCEWKGRAEYWDVVVGDHLAAAAAWSYPAPTERFAPLAGFVAFYPQRMDACFVDGERVSANPGNFYGGWITSHVVGPFKGGSGTAGW